MCKQSFSNVAYKRGKLKTIFIPFLLVLEFCKRIFALTIILPVLLFTSATRGITLNKECYLNPLDRDLAWVG